MNFIISKEFKAVLASESYWGLVNSITHYALRIPHLESNSPLVSDFSSRSVIQLRIANCTLCNRNDLGILNLISKEFKAVLASESYLELVNSITHYALRIPH